MFGWLKKLFDMILRIEMEFYTRQEECILSLSGYIDSVSDKKYKPESHAKRKQMWAAMYGMQEWDDTEWGLLKDDIDNMYDGAENNLASILTFLQDMGYEKGYADMVLRNLCHNNWIKDETRAALVDIWLNHTMLDSGETINHMYGDIIPLNRESYVTEFRAKVLSGCLPINSSIDDLKDAVIDITTKKEKGKMINTILQVVGDKTHDQPIIPAANSASVVIDMPSPKKKRLHEKKLDKTALLAD